MFKYFNRFRAVVVSGPQRSGTTICSHMICHDTGYTYVDENSYGTKNLQAFLELAQTGQQIVIQAPAMSRYLGELKNYSDVAVVWMMRDVAAIARSEKRVNWLPVDEKQKYADVPEYNSKTPICIIKHIYWSLNQRNILHYPFEIEYERLDRHPLWVPQKKRKRFKRRQWKTTN